MYALPGDVSSQFFSGLLFALPLLEGDSLLVSTTQLESVGYVNMTRQAMERFGVKTKWTKEGIFIPGNQMYHPADCTVEADWSNAAFWYAAQGTGSDVTVTGMDERSIQGDRVILELGQMLRGEPLSGGIGVPVLGRAGAGPVQAPPPDLPRRYAVSISVSHAPDLVPPLAAWGPVTRLRSEAEKRRPAADEGERPALHRDGGAHRPGGGHRGAGGCPGDPGKAKLPGGVTVSGHNDHRIAMMAAIAATRCEKPVTITGAECVKKSYPGFWEDYEKLGGQLTRA